MVLLIGGLGSIGQRYAAILNRLNIAFEVADADYGGGVDVQLSLGLYEFDRAIIASPTETHYEYCKQLISLGKPFLCEKPLSKDLDECIELVNSGAVGHVVNNYVFAISPYGTRYRGLSYNYYNTGNDGMYWDLCQLIHIDNKIDIQTDSPVFSLNLGYLEIPYSSVEHSYVRMIEAWINADTDQLWTLEDGMNMTYSVIERMKRDGVEE